VTELLRLLVKAQKSERLYGANNDIAKRLSSDLFRKLEAHLEEHGEVALGVGEFRVRCEHAVVYASEDRNDSLAFLLYRDGIRRLSFHPGIEASELTAFLGCLNHVAQISGEQDDLVTLFWEQDFHAIRYFAIEELDAGSNYPKLSEQLASGELAGSASSGAGAERVSLDLEQPVTTVPVEVCRLTDEDVERLRAELAEEEGNSFPHLVSELAIELTLLEDDEDTRAELASGLRDIVDGLIAKGELMDVVSVHEHLDGLQRMLFAGEQSVGALSEGLRHTLAEPARVERLLSKIDKFANPTPNALTAFLARLGLATEPAVLAWMGRFQSPAYRRAVTRALLSTDDGGLEAMRAGLEHVAREPTPVDPLQHHHYVREILHALSQHPGKVAVPLLERFLRSNDATTRRESFAAISRYPDDRVNELAMDRLFDPDPSIRTTALDTIVRRGTEGIGFELLQLALRDPRVAPLRLREKRRLFAAVAKLCGQKAFSTIAERLRGKEAGWFTAKRHREDIEALAHGVRMIGSDDARALLAELARSAPRVIRIVCAKELEAMGAPAVDPRLATKGAPTAPKGNRR
jgi:hypothetical protein